MTAEFAARTSHAGRSIALAACLGLLAGLALPAPPDERVDFVRDVRPILAAHCHSCHGPEKSKADLRLDRRAEAMAGSHGGTTAVIVPGDAGASLLIERLTTDDEDDRMPRDAAALSAADIELLSAWIDQGADWPEDADTGASSPAAHWAYVAPVEPLLPPGPADLSPIDRFILQRLSQEGLAPSPQADRATLVRRLSLDLVGLSPSPQEVDAFERDTAPDSYARLVDLLLASPHFGEKQAQAWLDLARYADTNGYEKDARRAAWRYRDWVIEAFNRNLPYDEFVIEQLAGDLLPDATLEQKLATGFHRNTLVNEEGGTDAEEFRWAAVVDRTNTTASVFLGSTLACAQCHNHKYDPFSQKEYYELLACFDNTVDGGKTLEPAMPAPRFDEALQLQCLQSLEAELVARGDVPDALAAVRCELQALQDSLPTALVLQERDEARETHLRIRGAFLSPGEVVHPGVPAVLGELPPDAPRNRLGLARWIVSRDNPLAARVAVNRFWEQLFGRGLVASSDDFGTRGSPPTHPELLDWLALRFMESGWDVKALLRTIVTSAAYRQDSRTTREVLEKDPANVWLSHAPRLRLPVETLRDMALSASGLLDPMLGGPSVFPPQPDGVWAPVYSDDQWTTDTGSSRWRRGLYTFWRRSSPYATFMLFDAPSRELACTRRSRTNTPLQALALLNDPAFVECAAALARRMLREGGPDVASRASFGFRACTARVPDADELAVLVSLFEDLHAHYSADPAAAAALAAAVPAAAFALPSSPSTASPSPDSPASPSPASPSPASESPASGSAPGSAPARPAPVVDDPVEVAAWTCVANALFNLDETLTRN